MCGSPKWISNIIAYFKHMSEFDMANYVQHIGYRMQEAIQELVLWMTVECPVIKPYNGTGNKPMS